MTGIEVAIGVFILTMLGFKLSDQMLNRRQPAIGPQIRRELRSHIHNPDGARDAELRRASLIFHRFNDTTASGFILSDNLTSRLQEWLRKYSAVEDTPGQLFDECVPLMRSIMRESDKSGGQLELLDPDSYRYVAEWLQSFDKWYEGETR